MKMAYPQSCFFSKAEDPDGCGGVGGITEKRGGEGYEIKYGVGIRLIRKRGNDDEKFLTPGGSGMLDVGLGYSVRFVILTYSVINTGVLANNLWNWEG